MSDKAPWGLGNLFGKAPVKPLATSAQKCPSGKHAMSAGWSKCPYCEAERNSGEKTRINIDDAPAPEADFAGGASMRPGPTRVNTVIDITGEVPQGTDDRRETKILPEAADGVLRLAGAQPRKAVTARAGLVEPVPAGQAPEAPPACWAARISPRHQARRAAPTRGGGSPASW